MIGGVDRDYDSIGGRGCNTWIRPRRKPAVVRRIAETTTGAAERDGGDAAGAERDEITPGQGVAMHSLRILDPEQISADAAQDVRVFAQLPAFVSQHA